MSQKYHFDYNDLPLNIMRAVRAGDAVHRVISLDLETKILNKDDFLTGERILAVGVARRTGNEIERTIFKLQDDTDEAEIELLDKTARWMSLVRPLVLVGYNICGYDFPLLCLKLKWYESTLRAKSAPAKPIYPKEYWALKDSLTRSYILDLMHPLRFAIAEHEKTSPKYRTLGYCVDHQMNQHLPLMRRKALATGTDTQDKGQRIYALWKNNNLDFEKYLEGDVHDVLVLAEDLFK